MSLKDYILVGSSMGRAYYTKQQADEEAAEIERQAQQTKLAAQSRELERRQRINKALAANVVSQAAGGIKAEGTPQSIALESAKQISLSEGMEQLSDRLKIAQMQRAAKRTKEAGRVKAVQSLLGDAERGARLG